MSKHAGRLKRKWRESTLREKGEKEKDGGKREKEGSVPLDRRNIRLRSQQLFQSTKQRVAGRVEKLSHAGLDISPQNGFFNIRPTSDYLVKCVTSPLITLIDFRNQAEYKEMHLRTAINIPSKYLNLPSFEEASLQSGDIKDKEHPVSPSEDDVLAPFDLEPLISQAEMDSNHELFKNTWIDDILQYSLEKKVSHQFVIYCSEPRARRSPILPGVLHVLKSIYREQIEGGQLEIYVLKNGFEKMRTEKWLLPSLCASTDLFRRTPVYSAMEFTDDDVYTEVLPYLFLSSSIGATNAEQLQKNGITVVLNLTEKQIDYPPGDFATVHVCMADIRSQNTTDPITQSNEIIEDARRNLGRVLVHCTRGQSRSPIIAIAYLMKSRSWALLKSFLFVREKRPWIGPNPSFMSQLMIYEDQLQLSPSSQFPLHAYTLLESRDEDFDENVRVLGLYYNYPQDLFDLLEVHDLKRAQLLLKEDATFRYTRRSSESDETPLHFALEMIGSDLVDREQLVELVKELTDSTTINQDTLLGETPLILAVRKGDPFFTRYLLGENANVALINSSGKNALHYAAAQLHDGSGSGSPEILHELLKASRHQRQVIIEDIHGFTPLDYALFSSELFLMQTKFLEELVPEDETPTEGADFCLGEQLALFTMNLIRTKVWQFVFNKWFSPKMQLENEQMLITTDVFRRLCEEAFPDPDRMPTNQSNRTAWKLEKRGRSKVSLYGSAAEILPHTNAPILERNVLHFLIDSVKDHFPQHDPESLFGILNSLFSELPDDHRETVKMVDVLKESDDLLSELIHKGLPALTAEECGAIVDSVLSDCQACLKAVPHLKVKGKESR